MKELTKKNVTVNELFELTTDSKMPDGYTVEIDIPGSFDCDGLIVAPRDESKRRQSNWFGAQIGDGFARCYLAVDVGADRLIDFLPTLKAAYDALPEGE